MKHKKTKYVKTAREIIASSSKREVLKFRQHFRHYWNIAELDLEFVNKSIFLSMISFFVVSLQRCYTVRLILFFLICSIQAAQQQIVNVLRDKEEWQTEKVVNEEVKKEQ